MSGASLPAGSGLLSFHTLLPTYNNSSSRQRGRTSQAAALHTWELALQMERKPGRCHHRPFSLDSGYAQTTRSLELNTLRSSSPPLMLSTSSSTSSLNGVCREVNKSSSSKSCSCPDPELEVQSELNYLERCLTPSLFPKIWAGTENEISPGHYISSSFALGMSVLALCAHPHSVP